MEVGKKISGMFHSALQRAAGAAFEVETMEDTTIVDFRYDTCKACIHFDPNAKKCTICGCYMEIKTTMKKNVNIRHMEVEFTHCPKGKWGDLEIANHYRAARGQQLIT